MNILGKIKDGIHGSELVLTKKDKSSKSKITTATKRNLIEERGRICEYCGKTYAEWVFEVHHIIPREYEECTETKDNYLVLCANCHKEFTHKWDELRKYGTEGITTKNITCLPEVIVE